jgi:hypothetical protein
MSATYNWKYKGGSLVFAKTGNPAIDAQAIATPLAIAASADDVRPSNTAYAALFGNDTTGNGSRRMPFRTISKAASLSPDIVVIGSGVYRETISSPGGWNYWVGDGNVVIDGTALPGFTSSANGYFLKLTIRNCIIKAFDTRFQDCVFSDCTFTAVAALIINNCLIERCITKLSLAIPGSVNNTFIDCYDLRVQDPGVAYNTWLNIYKSCNIWFRSQSFISHSLFHHCNVRFNASQGDAPTAPYTTIPAGYAQITTLPDLRAAHLAGFPGSSLFNFVGSAVDDPLFNNYAIGDYSLAFNSPAKNLSYFGSYVGYKSIAYPITARATETNGAFEFSSAVNLHVGDDSITLANPVIDAQIDTHVVVNPLAREIANLPSYGFNADRNGQYIDSLADLDPATKVAGDVLTFPASYLAETGAIVYNGATYQPGERFTTVSGQSVFTTVAAGVVREILEAPQRLTIMARFTDGGGVVTAGTALTIGYYYFVVSGSVSYNSVLYDAGQVFKATDTHAFSGSGVVIAAFGTESFQHYEQGTRPTSNNTGDARTGTIIRGNGDPAYDRGGLGIKEFPVNAKFIQIRYIIRTHNLKP